MADEMVFIPMRYHVDLDRTINTTPLNTLFAMGDNQAHRFELTITHGSVADDLTGCEVKGKFVSFSNNMTVILTGSVENGNAVVTLKQPCYTQLGRFALVIQIIKDDVKTSVFYGDGYMRNTSTDNAIIDGEYIVYDTDVLLSKIQEIETAIAGANEAISGANAAASAANAAAENVDANMDAKITARVDKTLSVDGGIADAKETGREIGQLKNDLEYNVINLDNDFENGNFQNTGGWYGTQCTIATNENILNITPINIYPRIESSGINNLIIGDIYYVSVKFKSEKECLLINFSNFSPVLKFPTNSAVGNFEMLSGIAEVTNESFRFNMYLPNDTTDFDTYKMYVKKAIAINLTKTFGKGNEPTKEIMDKLVNENPTLWWGNVNSFSQKQILDLITYKLDKIFAFLNNKKSSIKVMSYNCGTWYDGVTRVPNDEVEDLTYYTRGLFSNFDCDFILGQECSKYFDVENTILAIPQVMDFKYDYNTEESYTHISESLRCPVFSKTPLADTSIKIYTNTVNYRHFIKTYATINNVKVCFISTLLDKDDTNRKSQINEIISVMNQEEYVVLGGDFNIKDKSEYQDFENAGYLLCNGGILGWFDTLASYDDGIIRPIDNIIISSNIKINNVYVDTNREKDHRAIIAELSIN